MPGPDKAKLPNLVALGFIGQDGAEDAVAVLRVALANLKAKGATGAYLPGVPANKPGYRYRPVFNYWKHPERGLVIPPGFTLIGDGPGSTRFFADASAYANAPNWPAAAFLFMSDDSALRGVGFDGKRELLADGAETKQGGVFVRAATDATSRVTIADVTATGNIGGLNESFTIQTGVQSRDWSFERVHCRANNGSGLSLNGDMPAEIRSPGHGLTGGHRVIDCSGFENTWQGMTAYGCENTLIRNFDGRGNGTRRRGGNGLNIEWSYHLRVEGVSARDNFGAGVGGFGDVADLMLVAPTLRDNNAAGWNTVGEIGFGPGPWWDNSCTGLLRSMEIQGGSITPRPGLYHLDVGRGRCARVTYPVAGPPGVPQVVAKNVGGLGDAAAWKLTPSTDRSGLRAL